ncbi:hypothetical protein SHIRM173S_07441 [Streptomyces hirsutus]
MRRPGPGRRRRGLELEAETFEISDYSDASEVVLAGCTSTSSTSTSSSTCSTTYACSA